MPIRFTTPPNRIEFQNTVWEIVRQIPPGKVATYGQIAAMIPPPEKVEPASYRSLVPRWVGSAMASCPEDVPWQRVINSQGKISPRPGAALQRQLLEAEAVVFNESDKVDFDRFGWEGPSAEWCQERGLLLPPKLGKRNPRLF